MTKAGTTNCVGRADAQAVKSKKQPRLTLGLGHEPTSMSEAFEEEMDNINTEVSHADSAYVLELWTD